jgi:hypothetical protein
VLFKLLYKNHISDSIMNVLQIVITLEIYGVTEIVGIPFGYRGFTDKELTEVQVISYLSSC